MNHIAVTTDALSVPGARLHYELRGSGPLVALVGSPMDARAFAPLADLLAAAGYQVLTTDPRGIRRSELDDPGQDSTPELRADDLARLLEHVGGGPATVFGSSGGAVTALALVQARPDLVDTVIPHEPPLVELLPDRAELHAGTEKMISVYESGDTLGAWRMFMEQANIQLPEGALEMIFGGEKEPQDVADERRGMTHEMYPTTLFRPDLDALRAADCRIVLGIGADSGGELCERTTEALAKELGLQPVRFPGGHTGFADDAAGFCPRLVEVLAG
ncbi:alpha/beta hydrolase [Streptomyces sp. A7024]|uniref:Alpha/beta hydrolase n=1 Tax=Streptomyces coryli TaxID=1128680 RepID=A0A6G4UD56_9ACTN|nr:alpha/beta hydrolase [Streptomyces coryli]NGN69606.1 alpha/beta hydrolase [Streptomyces coryli]